MFKIVYARFW